jgi:hypothetical protein
MCTIQDLKEMNSFALVFISFPIWGVLSAATCTAQNPEFPMG